LSGVAGCRNWALANEVKIKNRKVLRDFIGNLIIIEVTFISLKLKAQSLKPAYIQKGLRGKIGVTF
jgi:hypothetical protein